MRSDLGVSSADLLATNVEIAHVLFMDLVRFSPLSMEAQAALVEELQQVVRGTAEVQRTDLEGTLLIRPTGDGMALVFFHDSLSPIRCALEIAQELTHRPHIKLRMGIHSGPVYRIRDINSNLDVSGDGIVTAQRVMDYADAGHILVSRPVAEMLSKLDTWARCLDDLGLCEVKHGMQVHIFNFFTKELGNRSKPRKFLAAKAAFAEQMRRRAATPPTFSRVQPFKDGLIILLWMVSVLGLAFGTLWFASPSFRELVHSAFAPTADHASPPNPLASQDIRHLPPGEIPATEPTPAESPLASSGSSQSNDPTSARSRSKSAKIKKRNVAPTIDPAPNDTTTSPDNSTPDTAGKDTSHQDDAGTGATNGNTDPTDTDNSDKNSDGDTSSSTDTTNDNNSTGNK
jgi:class 3 adenylate cyclase